MYLLQLIFFHLFIVVIHFYIGFLVNQQRSENKYRVTISVLRTIKNMYIMYAYNVYNTIYGVYKILLNLSTVVYYKRFFFAYFFRRI